MKKETDDIANCKLRHRNNAEKFPYVFPQMPPRFRYYCVFARLLYLLEWGCCLLMILSGLVMLGFLGIGGKAAFDALLYENTWGAFLMVVFFASLVLGPVCRLLRHTPKFFWRCPCCGAHFPYYAPPLRGVDILKEADCFYSMKRLRIQYVKRKFCPLIVPSVCPECKCKFFDMECGSSTGDE